MKKVSEHYKFPWQKIESITMSEIATWMISNAVNTLFTMRIIVKLHMTESIKSTTFNITLLAFEVKSLKQNAL